jgi:hypothetical protein
VENDDWLQLFQAAYYSPIDPKRRFSDADAAQIFCLRGNLKRAFPPWPQAPELILMDLCRMFSDLLECRKSTAIPLGIPAHAGHSG